MLAEPPGAAERKRGQAKPFEPGGNSFPHSEGGPIVAESPTFLERMLDYLDRNDETLARETLCADTQVASARGAAQRRRIAELDHEERLGLRRLISHARRAEAIRALPHG